MKFHANHRICPSSRLLMCRRVLEKGWTLRQPAEAAGCSVRTEAKWLARFRDGDRELLDRLALAPGSTDSSGRPDRVDRVGAQAEAILPTAGE